MGTFDGSIIVALVGVSMVVLGMSQYIMKLIKRMDIDTDECNDAILERDRQILAMKYEIKRWKQIARKYYNLHKNGN